MAASGARASALDGPGAPPVSRPQTSPSWTAHAQNRTALCRPCSVASTDWGEPPPCQSETHPDQHVSIPTGSQTALSRKILKIAVDRFDQKGIGCVKYLGSSE